MLTIEDIRNPVRKSGFDHVGNKDTPGHPQPHKPFQADVYGGKRDKAGRSWSGPARATAEEAAQDYCDYLNGHGLAPTTATLKTAGHKYTAPKVAQQRGDAQGYVYAITDGEFVKIGYSVNPSKRIAELQTGNARLLSLVGTIPGTESDERKLHAKYEHLNVLQEWFEIDTDLLAEFATQPAAMQQAA